MVLIRALLGLAMLVAACLAPLDALACDLAAKAEPSASHAEPALAPSPCHGEAAETEDADAPSSPDCTCGLACALRAATLAGPAFASPLRLALTIDRPFAIEAEPFGRLDAIEPPPPRA